MARTHQPSNAGDQSATAEALRVGLAVFALYNLALAAFMALAPHAFYKAVGPFGAFNGHYIRDVATFSAALGFGFAASLSRPSWRLPVIAVSTVQFALHTVNHLFDASSAHPQWTGWFDFVSLLAATLLLAWMWRAAARLAATARPHPEPTGATPAASSVASPLPERSPT